MMRPFSITCIASIVLPVHSSSYYCANDADSESDGWWETMWGSHRVMCCTQTWSTEDKACADASHTRYKKIHGQCGKMNTAEDVDHYYMCCEKWNSAHDCTDSSNASPTPMGDYLGSSQSASMHDDSNTSLRDSLEISGSGSAASSRSTASDS